MGGGVFIFIVLTLVELYRWSNPSQQQARTKESRDNVSDIAEHTYSRSALSHTVIEHGANGQAHNRTRTHIRSLSAHRKPHCKRTHVHSLYALTIVDLHDHMRTWKDVSASVMDIYLRAFICGRWQLDNEWEWTRAGVGCFYFASARAALLCARIILIKSFLLWNT
jgi:hypothetical protein